jgi:plasmid stability protein
MMLMRTTLTLNDDVLKRARQKAARENRSLREVINEALRQGLTLGDRRKGTRYAFRLKTVAGPVMPGVDLHDRDKLFDLLDGR